MALSRGVDEDDDPMSASEIMDMPFVDLSSPEAVAAATAAAAAAGDAHAVQQADIGLTETVGHWAAPGMLNDDGTRIDSVEVDPDDSDDGVDLEGTRNEPVLMAPPPGVGFELEDETPPPPAVSNKPPLASPTALAGTSAPAPAMQGPPPTVVFEPMDPLPHRPPPAARADGSKPLFRPAAGQQSATASAMTGGRPPQAGGPSRDSRDVESIPVLDKPPSLSSAPARIAADGPPIAHPASSSEGVIRSGQYDIGLSESVGFWGPAEEAQRTAALRDANPGTPAPPSKPSAEQRAASGRPMDPPTPGQLVHEAAIPSPARPAAPLPPGTVSAPAKPQRPWAGGARNQPPAAGPAPIQRPAGPTGVGRAKPVAIGRPEPLRRDSLAANPGSPAETRVPGQEVYHELATLRRQLQFWQRWAVASTFAALICGLLACLAVLTRS